MEGKVRNLQGNFTDFSNLQISYELQQIVDNPNFQTATIYDGVITDRNSNAELVSDVVIASAGNHALDVLRIPVNSQYHSYINYAYGNSVYLNWNHSESPDTAYYVVKRGGVEVARITNCVVDSKVLEYSAPGGGRYSVSGQTNETINDTFSVNFGINEFTFNGTAYPFLSAGLTFFLDYGIQLTLHDDPSTYGNFDIFVGLQSYIVLTNQPEGSNTYAVTAFDEAGNNSNVVDKVVYVHPLPDSFTFNETTSTVTSFGANISHFNVYADHLPADGIDLPYIYEDAPVQVITSGSPTVNLPIGTKFYLFPVVGGIQHRNLNLYEIPDPAIEVGTFGSIADVRLTTIAAGNFDISFTYEFTETDKTSGFNVYYSTNGINFSVAIQIPVGSISADFFYGTVLEYSSDLSLAIAHGTTVYAYVKPYDSNALEGDASETVTAVSDQVAPEIAGDLHGTNI